MTLEEAINELKEEWKIFVEGTGLDDPEKLQKELASNTDCKQVYQANQMAIKSLEAWKQLKDELLSKSYRYTISAERGCTGNVLWEGNLMPIDEVAEIIKFHRRKPRSFSFLDECVSKPSP